MMDDVDMAKAWDEFVGDDGDPVVHPLFSAGFHAGKDSANSELRAVEAWNKRVAEAQEELARLRAENAEMREALMVASRVISEAKYWQELVAVGNASPD